MVRSTWNSCPIKMNNNGIARTLKMLGTSKGDYWIKQWFSSIASLFKMGTSLKGKNFLPEGTNSFLYVQFLIVASFCYLGDMLSAGGGCEMAVTTRVKTAWKKFRELLPVLTSHHLSYKTRGHVYSSCVRSTMLHASETWPLTKTNLQRLQRNDRAMIRQICSIKPEDVARVRSSKLLAKLQLEDLDLILRKRRLRWFGHVARSSGAIRTAYDMQIDGKRGAGRPKQTWKKLTEKDCREWKLTTVDPQERRSWRSGVRSAMRAASQLPGKGPTDVDDAPAPAR